MKRITSTLMLSAVFAMTQGALSDVLYTQDFTGTGGFTSDFGWTSYIESVKTADSVKRVAVNPTYNPADAKQNVDAVSALDYGFYAPKQASVGTGLVAAEATYIGHDALIFTDAVAGLTMAGLEELSMSLDTDSTDSDVRFAVQVDSQWYVSATSYGGNSGGYVTRTLVNSVAAPAQWKSLVVVTGDNGEITVEDADVAAPVGTITSYGFYAYAGLNGDLGEAGDHVRYDDFQVTGTIPEPATLGLVATFGCGVLFIRRRFMM